ncbi:hypothetical protein AYR62_00090 [Secundilactobacillus paracollinoides]|uniref:MFS transporter n=1 Tax=Secundilactobacillus paracollinoides TaxID=240427 RepID=UPI00081A9B92|nr:MFS transporter [Secundilactobacillus paracollinoides]ANZ62652.1 hypothetical protein AYR62_00090 [Secundilactobacillus paracollinoides]
MNQTSDNRDSLSFKIALLSSTFLITGASATSALLPSLRQAFPSVSKATLQSFFSITSLPQFIALIAAAFLATKIGKRNVILFGALLWTISGLLPMVLNNFPIILASRVFLGLSLGLIQPIGTSMIADLYTGEVRNTLMGIQSAVIGISGTVLTFAIGLLITINWRSAFLIYLLGLVVFVLTLHFLPKKLAGEGENQRIDNSENSSNGTSRHLGKDVIVWVLLTFFFNLGQGGVNIDFNLAVVEEHIATATGAANMMVAYSVLGLITGLLFGFYIKFAKRFGGIIAAVLFFMGNLIIATTHGVVVYYIAMMLTGAGFGLFMPYMFAAVNKHTTAANSAYATSATTAAASLANFIAPYVYSFLANVFGNNTSQFAFNFASAFSLILVLGLIYEYFTDTKKQKSILKGTD